MKIGGYFKANNVDAFIGVLQKDFGVRADARRNGIALFAVDSAE